MDQLETIVSIASDITAALSSEERYRRLLLALRRVIPYDAASLLRLDGDALVPVVAVGLTEDALARRFVLREQPRLEIICRSDVPVLFPADSGLPDPFDGLITGDVGGLGSVHSCLGCPLHVGGELIGALTADAKHPRAFDKIEINYLSAVGALAAAEMRTTHLIEALEQSAERQGLIARDLMRDVQLRQGPEMIGTTPVMQRLRQDIELVARSDFTVLIQGETGTGKELVARAVHNASERRAEPMLYVNCAALPETLADSELFGHVRGAFTGAAVDRAGKFEVASGGTLFLDEIGELPLSVQPKLLRAIQQGEIQRVGSDEIIKADVRLVAATNRDLKQEVEADRFRADLFHRLNVYPLRVPALRERVKDISLLAGYFADVTRRRLGIGPVRFEAETLDALERYLWPGNVRELENVLARVILRGAPGTPRGERVVLSVADLGSEFSAPGSALRPSGTARVDETPSIKTLKEATRDFQRARIRDAIASHAGNWAAAARALGMHRSNFHHLARRLGIE